MNMDTDPILFAGVKETPHLVRKVDIYCDGKEVRKCIAANVTEGWCDVFDTYEHGSIRMNAERTDAARKRIYGTVRIERKAGTCP